MSYNKTPCEKDGELHYGPYWDTGNGNIILREALDADHPEHLYNYLKSYEITPEDYGIRHPDVIFAEAYYEHMSRDELIKLVMQQQKLIDNMERNGF